ncbi:MAG: hypothetical protein ACRDJE_21830 [Dehalococcoidia bacterium]
MRFPIVLLALVGVLLVAGRAVEVEDVAKASGQAAVRDGSTCPLDEAACAFAEQLGGWVATGDLDAIVAQSAPGSFRCEGPDPDHGLGRPYSVCDGVPRGEHREGYPVGRLNSEAGVLSAAFFREELAGWLAWSRATAVGEADGFGSDGRQIMSLACPLLRDGVRQAEDAGACAGEYVVVFSGLYHSGGPMPAVFRGAGIFLVRREGDGSHRVIGFAQGGLLGDDPRVVLGGGSGTVFGFPFAPGHPVFGTFLPWTPAAAGPVP